MSATGPGEDVITWSEVAFGVAPEESDDEAEPKEYPRASGTSQQAASTLKVSTTGGSVEDCAPPAPSRREKCLGDDVSDAAASASTAGSEDDDDELRQLEGEVHQAMASMKSIEEPSAEPETVAPGMGGDTSCGGGMAGVGRAAELGE